MLIAISSPKQELIAEKLFVEQKIKCFCVGGAVNMLCGNEKVSPVFLQKLGLESLFRLHHEPLRRLKRLLYTLPRGVLGLFVLKFFKAERS